MITQLASGRRVWFAVFVALSASALSPNVVSAEDSGIPHLRILPGLQPIHIYKLKNNPAAVAVPAPARAAVPVPRAVPASPVRSAKLEFVLVNNTRTWLSLYINGRRSISVRPGHRGATWIAPGHYRFRAQSPDGRWAERSGRVRLPGQTWTLN